ncbi:MAG: DUF6188 family protein [Nocardioides sp.]|uniref:DUF6188 family protein n=1 Tax=Nocardioides sp. TaxID=35761 RepID=UPI0032676CFD
MSEGADDFAAKVASLISGSSVRVSDASGSAASADPRLAEQLQLIVGRKLSQFSVSRFAIRLAFWGEDIGSVSREIQVEHETLELRLPNSDRTASLDRDDPVAVTSLLSALSQPVIRLSVDDGKLVVELKGGLVIGVDSDEHYESWQINSDDGLLIVCAPGGELTIWYPESQS